MEVEMQINLKIILLIKATKYGAIGGNKKGRMIKTSWQQVKVDFLMK
jgi:hypothetical protein